MCLLLQETLDSQREGSHPFSPFLNESSSQLRAGGGTQTELLSGTFEEKLFLILIFLPILILKLILTKTYPPSITHLPHKYQMGGKPPNPKRRTLPIRTKARED